VKALFKKLRKESRCGLIAYLTCGDGPTVEIILALADAGVDAIELGVPFSDPIGDGPVIQQASVRALANGVTLMRVLETVVELRRETDVPIVLMAYYNSILAFGLKSFAESARKAAVDGAIVLDLPPDEAEPLAREADPVGLDLVYLVAPTSTPARVRMIAQKSRGFIYVVSLTGVTGERTELPAELTGQIAALRRITGKPLCVGFGIGRPEQAAAMGRLADGVIVGSAIVRLVAERTGSATMVRDVGDFIASLKAPLRDVGPGRR
jgi:tryptophan synthase alpha chain